MQFDSHSSNNEHLIYPSLNNDYNTFPSSPPENLKSVLVHKIKNILYPSPEDKYPSSPSENLESLLSDSIKNILYPSPNSETPDIPPDHKNPDPTSTSSNISESFSAQLHVGYVG